MGNRSGEMRPMAYNQHLDQFLMFYSQSDAGNGLTRGLDSDLAKRTYVGTKLDRTLTDAVLSKQFRIVILTGNAGDGKTAFIQKVEEAAAGRGADVKRTDTLGSRFTLQGRLFKTLYDGSVETADASNQEMLREFFSEVAGPTAPTVDVCLIVAMNEGKLRDFLSHATGFTWLSRTILDHLQRAAPLPAEVALVNLNLRSVVDAEEGVTDCLFDQILDRYVADEFWTPCQNCPSRHRCPVKFNVDSFRLQPTDGLDGKELEVVTERNRSAKQSRSALKSLFQVLHFRSRIHVTVRDLRSVLAFTLFGKKSCREIEAEIQAGQTDFTDRYYYNAVFNASEKDRILALLRETDVGMASAPQVDSKLSFTKPRTGDFRRLFSSFDDPKPDESRTRIDEDDLLRLFNAKPTSPDQRTPGAVAAAQKYVVAMRRKMFFEGRRDPNTGPRPSLIEELLPYDKLRNFIEFIRSGNDVNGQLKDAIILAISRSESIFDEQRGRENVCIRTRHEAGAKVKAFFTYPADHFVVSREESGPSAQFVEFLPSSILLTHHARKISLTISLDLYEMLMRIRDGYVPAAGEMRAFFLNLLMFKKQLMSLPSERMLLTETDYQIFELRRTPTNGIALSSV